MSPKHHIPTARELIDGALSKNAIRSVSGGLQSRTLRRYAVSKDICPNCGGPLDTGWECNECGYDAIAEAPNQ